MDSKIKDFETNNKTYKNARSELSAAKEAHKQADKDYDFAHKEADRLLEARRKQALEVKNKETALKEATTHLTELQKNKKALESKEKMQTNTKNNDEDKRSKLTPELNKLTAAHQKAAKAYKVKSSEFISF